MPDRPQDGRLAELLRELRKVDAAIRTVPAIRMHGVPGRKPEHALMPMSDEHEGELRALQERRAAVLERMSREVLPTGRWVLHRRKLLYLTPLPDSDGGPEDFELYVLPARASRWIPEETPEHPGITERRFAYARRLSMSRRQAALLLCLLATTIAAPFVWGAADGLVFAVLLLGGLAVLAEGRRYWARKIFGGEEPYDPFEVVSPGTGEHSEGLRLLAEGRRERERERVLEAVAPEAPAPMRKTHDYEYPYEGFYPGAGATCRVRIYQHEREETGPPVVVLSQDLDELTGTSLTNLIEAVAAEVVLANLDHLLPKSFLDDRRARKSPPFRVVEHYSKGHPGWHPEPGDRDGEAFAVITFAGYRVQSPLDLPEVEHAIVDGEEYTIVHANSTERPRLGEPEWRHVGRTAAEKMVGQEL